MPENLTPKTTDLKAWLLMHRVRDLAFYLQDRICGQYGITLEQYTVLIAVRYLDSPVTASDIARWAGHQVNTISMITNRMVKAGLLRRTRDLPDRRLVRFTITKKAEEILKQATPAVWTLVEDALSPLSEKERSTLAELLGKVRAGLLPHFTRDAAIRISASYETSDLTRLITRLGNYARAPALAPNRQGPASRGTAALDPRPTRVRTTMKEGRTGVSY